MSRCGLRTGLSLVVSLMATACLETDEQEQCSTLPSQIYTVAVFDDDAPVGSVARLEVEAAGTGLDHRSAVEPWPGEDELRFPLRLVPILANQAGGTVTVTAYDLDLAVIGSGTGTLVWRDDVGECAASSTADQFVEIELN